MKTALKIIAITLLAVLVSLNGFCQLPAIKATQQGWAGGICCRSGTNYHVILTGEKGSLAGFKVNSVCISGLQFEASQINVRTETVYNKDIVYLNMSVSHDETDRPNLNKEQVVQQPCTNMQVNYLTGRKHQTVIIDKVETLEFLAYP